MASGIVRSAIAVVMEKLLSHPGIEILVSEILIIFSFFSN
jgi:hypothetical protein